MSQQPVYILPEAVREIAAARSWYAERSPGVAERFMDEVTQGVNQIAREPQLWPAYLHGTRRYLLRHFPYVVVYRPCNDRILVVAVAHGRRRPGYWRTRQIEGA
jgi:toxin ParE1/3/4